MSTSVNTNSMHASSLHYKSQFSIDISFFTDNISAGDFSIDERIKIIHKLYTCREYSTEKEVFSITFNALDVKMCIMFNDFNFYDIDDTDRLTPLITDMGSLYNFIPMILRNNGVSKIARYLEKISLLANENKTLLYFTNTSVDIDVLTLVLVRLHNKAVQTKLNMVAEINA